MEGLRCSLIYGTEETHEEIQGNFSLLRFKIKISTRLIFFLSVYHNNSLLKPTVRIW